MRLQHDACVHTIFGIIIAMMENKAAITKMSTNNDHSLLGTRYIWSRPRGQNDNDNNGKKKWEKKEDTLYTESYRIIL